MIKLTKAKINQLYQLSLTKLKSGDQNNDVFYSNFSDEEKKKKFIDKLVQNLSKNASSVIEATIYNSTITDDQFRRISAYLTFSEIIEEMCGSKFDTNVNLLYFALLVNYNADNSKGVSKIQSASQLYAAKSINSELDYRDYVTKGTADDTKFAGDYKSIRLEPKNLSTGITLKLPVVNYKILPFFTFATEKVAGKISFDTDTSNTEYNVPANVWMHMIQEGVNARKSPRFPKHFDFGQIKKIVADDPKQIRALLALNLNKVADIMNAFKTEIDENGTLFLLNASKSMDMAELPENCGVYWDEQGSTEKKRLITSKEFYVIDTNGNTLDIYVPNK